MFVTAIVDDKIWIDILLFVVFSVVHMLAWSTSTATSQTTSATVATVSGAVTGGIQAVGILVPATLVAVTLAHPKSSTLSQFLYADIWFTLSLFFGLSLLWSIGVNANVLRRFVGYQYGLQLFSLGVGSIRLLIGIAILFSGGAS